jgi:hypothetical protein
MKTGALLNLALKGFARAGKKVVYIGQKAAIERDLRFISGSLPANDSAFKRIKMKYIGSGKELIQYLASMHLWEPAALLIVDNMSWFFPRYTTESTISLPSH